MKKVMCNKLVHTGLVPGGKAGIERERKRKTPVSMNHFIARGASRGSVSVRNGMVHAHGEDFGEIETAGGRKVA